MRPFATLVLAALCLTCVPFGAASLLGCPEFAIVQTFPVPTSGEPATFGPLPECGTEQSFVALSNVAARWAHDEPGITGLTVVFEADGVDPTPLALEEHHYVDLADGARGKTHYESAPIYFPSFQGDVLTATLYRDGVAIETAQVTAAI